MRLGILGGTFNPIHIGHLLLAECARQQCGLDAVWFMPAAQPPHKSSRELLDGRTRLRLIRLATQGHPAFQASDLELKQGGVSYTIRTIRALKARDPKTQLFFIIGSDMLEVPWRRFGELRRLCTFVVAARTAEATGRRRPGIRRIVMPRVDISSSSIRERVRRGRSIRYLVPEPVARAIARGRLYQGSKARG